MLRIDAPHLPVRARLFPAKSLILSVYLKHLDSNTLPDDNNWYISGYNLIILQGINEEVFVYIINII